MKKHEPERSRRGELAHAYASMGRRAPHSRAHVAPPVIKIVLDADEVTAVQGLLVEERKCHEALTKLRPRERDCVRVALGFPDAGIKELNEKLPLLGLKPITHDNLAKRLKDVYRALGLRGGRLELFARLHAFVGDSPCAKLFQFAEQVLRGCQFKPLATRRKPEALCKKTRRASARLAL